MTDYIKATSGEYLAKKVIDIGDWNMDALSEVDVPHGLTAEKIRHVSVVIRNDDNTMFHESVVVTPDFLAIQFAIYRWTATNINIIRKNASVFDSVNYDSTGYNRGWVTIEYDAS